MAQALPTKDIGGRDAAILQQQQPTMKLLIKFVVPIATPEWYSIGVFLDLPDATIKTIQREEKELKNVCIKIFREWLHGGAHPDRRSWKQVLEAVEESCGPGVSRNIKGRLIDYLVQEQSKGNEPQSNAGVGGMPTGTDRGAPAVFRLPEQCIQGAPQVLPRSPSHSSLGKKVHSIKLPDMPMRASSYAATIHNNKVYIRAAYERGIYVYCLLLYSIKEHTWRAFPLKQSASAITVVNNHVTLIGGRDLSTGKVTNTLPTWHEEGQWKQVLPPMASRRARPAVISHDNCLLVTGGVAEDDSTVLNTTDVLDLTTMRWTTPKGLKLPMPLWAHHLTLCGEYLYLVGGTTVFPFKSPEDYNFQVWRAKWSGIKHTVAPQHSQPQRGVWTQIAHSPTLGATAVSCGGRLYTVGGVLRNGKLVKTVYTYITARNQWVSVGDMSVGRAWHCAVPVSSTSMFVAGGRVVNEGKVSESPLTELLLL